jgi:hypothetical protein
VACRTLRVHNILQRPFSKAFFKGIILLSKFSALKMKAMHRSQAGNSIVL